MKKTILISLDALASTDLPFLRELPNFARMIHEGAYCPAEQSVYPSLTFPCHASIAIGCVPGNHGVVSNYFFDPFASIASWNYHVLSLKRKALWDYAAENNKTVLSLSWPVSAGANIRYSMPEMTPAKPKIWNFSSFASQIQVLFRNGTPSLAARALLLNPSLARAWFLGDQPSLDLGMIKLLKNSLNWYDSDITLFHIYGMDNERHHHGVNSPKAKQYLSIYDDLIGYLLDFVDQSALKGDTVTLMVTGDHAQRDVTHAIYGNYILADMGLCEWKNGKLKTWKALLDSCDGMAYLYVQEGHDTERIATEVTGRFRENPGVQKIMQPNEFRSLGCDPTAALVLEAKEGYGFEGGWPTESIHNPHALAPNHYKALHGYLPGLPDYQTLFFCYGKAVNQGVIESMSILDIAPTICDWMEMQTEAMDGRVLHGILKKE